MSKKLGERNKRICEDGEVMTYKAIGEKYKISKNRAYQIVRREKNEAQRRASFHNIKDGDYPDYFHFTDMDISFALRNSLINAGIERVGQAKDLEARQLLHIKRIGYVALRELCKKIWGKNVTHLNLNKINELVYKRRMGQ